MCITRCRCYWWNSCAHLLSRNLELWHDLVWATLVIIGCSSHSATATQPLRRSGKSGCTSHSGRVAEWLLRFREPCCTSTLLICIQLYIHFIHLVKGVGLVEMHLWWFGRGVWGGGVRPITFNCTDTHTWCYARDIFSCTYTHTSCYATDIFSCTHTHIRLFTLETSSLPHTHILPATLETSYLALTHILLFTLETSSLAHTHILMLRYRCFLLHIHILPASLYTSFLALTHILDATLETSFLAHTHRGKNVVLWRSFALQNAMECYNGSSKSPGFSRCNSNMKWLRRCGAKHIWFQNMHNC